MAAPYFPTCSVLSTSSSTRSIEPRSVKEIQYILCSPGISAPPLTLRLKDFHYNNLNAACENNLSEVAKVYESGQIFRNNDTSLIVKAPKLLENHILIASPLTICGTNPSSLLVHVYALQVDSNVVSRADIRSHLESEGFCHGLLCKQREYSFAVIKPHGYTSNEFRAGSVLCLVNADRLERNEATQIMRGFAEVLYAGNESIGVIPPFTAPFQGIEHERNTNCLVQDPLEEGGRDQDVVPHEAQLQDPLQEEGGDQDIISYQVQSQPESIDNQSQFVSSLPSLPCDSEMVSDFGPIFSDTKDKVHGDLIYAEGSFGAQYFPSEKYPSLPKHEDLGKKYTIIGQGRNGKVIHYQFDKMELALKYSKYDKPRMEMWARLRNPHIVQLLAVFVVHHASENLCCQFMLRMTCSLYSEFEKKLKGGILEALCTNQIQEDVLMPNLCHIFGSLLNALQYLKETNTVHQDFKYSNVLVNRQRCTCDNVYECTCIGKYIVQLSDFDSIQYVGCSPCPAHSPSPASLDGTKVPGTPEYRAAPEKFLKSCSCVVHANFIGPWTDMWSFGVFLIKHLSGNTKDKKIIAEANTLHGIVGKEEFNEKDYVPEIIAPILRLNEVLREVLHNPELYLNSKMVKEMIAMIDMCLVADYKMRATPCDLLECAFFN